MSCYVELEMTCTRFNQLSDYLVELVTRLDNPYEVMDLVRLIDFLDEEKERYRAKENKSLERYVKLQKLFEETYVDRDISTDNFMYYKVEKLLKDYGVELDIETQFHLIMSIIDLFKSSDVE